MTISNQENSKISPDPCATTPLIRAIHLLGDEWILLIISRLLDGPLRFNMLRASLGRISSKTLAQRLKLLEHLQFLERQAFLEIPPHVEYKLTPKGRELNEVLVALEKFGNKYLTDPIASMCNPCPSDDNDTTHYDAPSTC